MLKMALRQIRAYKQRTIITILLTLAATYMFVFLNGFAHGSRMIMIDAGVKLYPGFIKVINRDFDETPSFENLIFDMKDTLLKIQSADGVESASARFETFALYSTDEETIGGMFTAIQPESEAKISKLKDSLIEGEYLSSDDTNALYIGNEFASRLNIKLGDTISFISTGADYSFAADNVVIKGIFKTGLFSFNNGSAFMNKAYFDTVMASENIATSIVVKPVSEEDDDVLSITQNIQDNLSDEFWAQSYFVTMKELIDAMIIDEIFGYFQLSIFFVVIFFVVAIYNYLNIYGRIREFGILKSIGTTPAQITKMLFLEILILGSIGVGIGSGLATWNLKYLNENPVNVKALYGDSIDIEEYMKEYDMVMIDAMPADYNLESIFWHTLIIYIMTILTIIYPVIMVNRLKPVEAMHHV